MLRPGTPAAVPLGVRSRGFSQAAATVQDVDVHACLEKLAHPTKGTPLLESDLVKGVTVESGKVTVLLELNDQYRAVKKTIEAEVKSLSGVQSVVVKMAPRGNVDPSASSGSRRACGSGSSSVPPLASETHGRPGNLSGVKHIIAVASCKGGVGKSTTAVNLAMTLKRQGHRVGIYDADVFGPSLPTLISPDDRKMYRVSADTRDLKPIMYEDVKCMSFGFSQTGVGGSNSSTGLAIMRGPMVSQVVSDLLQLTTWGELDYLVMDLPPGTGDIQLTLCQLASIDAAVVVSTPAKLSYVDVVKGVEMFDKVKVPTVAVVENMTTFVCGACGHESHPFGRGYSERIQTQFGIENCFSVPVLEELATCNDSGRPAALNDSEPLAPIRETFDALANGVVSEIAKLAEGGSLVPAISPGATKTTITFADGPSAIISNVDLRAQCRCAECRDERTGEILLKYESIPKDISIKSVRKTGNYAVTVYWSTGHESIFPYDRLREFVEEKILEGR